MKTLIQNLSLCLICLLCFGLATETKAQGYRKMSLQGFLRDASGKVVSDGSQEMIFKLYTQAQGGTAQWTETQDVNVFGGVYSVHLGKLEKMDELSWGTKTYYVGVTVQGIELVPRTELTFAPYALGSPRATLADTADVEKCSGAVGDVKYSILNPDQFAKENGACWIPLDGRALARTDVLREKFGVSTLPNAGGLFLRGQEFGNSLDHDPSRTSASAIAELEEQAVQSHGHAINTTTGADGAASGSGSIPYKSEAGGFIDGDKSFASVSATDRSPDAYYSVSFITPAHIHRVRGNTDNNSGASAQETRPKNLNLWTYVRIN